MTIQVTVKNVDQRESAVIAVIHENLDGTNRHEQGRIKGGEEMQTYVCHDVRLVVEEISQ